MTEVEKKRAFNKLKHDLEPWRNVLVCLDSVLTWEKSFYPAAVGGGISLMYLFLWVMDLSTITMLALVGLAAVSADFGYPTVSRMLFSPDDWSTKQEAQFERVLTQIIAIKTTVTVWYEYLFTERKSTKFGIAIGVVLLLIAYIGAIFNNLMLMYVVTMVVAMYPGIQERQVFNQIKGKMGCVVNSKLQQFSEIDKKME